MRTLKRGRILFNQRRSVIDCVIRNLSATGARLQFESVIGLPETFDLQVEGEAHARPCCVMWQAADCIGVRFGAADVHRDAHPQTSTGTSMTPEAPSGAGPATADHVRSELLTLRAALDDVPFGIVLLDTEMRAQFLNRTFRRMWRLPDAKADAKPAFVALIHHGCDTLAYDIDRDKMAEYVEMRVRRVRAGDTQPMDIRLQSGEVIRFRCTPLPAGGRMLSYQYVTDIVQQYDELRFLRAALDNIEPGVILLDEKFVVRYTNPAVHRLWTLPDPQPGIPLTFADLVMVAGETQRYAVPPEELDAFLAGRIERVRSGDPKPYDIKLADGRVIRSQCAVLPSGARMITYNDITDLSRHAETLRHMATIDELTGIHNRRHFFEAGDAEWSRFQRYQRPLSLLSFDIDCFKQINDKYGHDVGDVALSHLARRCIETKRNSDTLARLGGDEFAMLLPETDVAQAEKVAGRLRAALRERPLEIDGAPHPLMLSIGIAEATISMSGLNALVKAADRALYEAKARGRNQAVCFTAQTEAHWPNAAE